MSKPSLKYLSIGAGLLLAFVVATLAADDPLPSWNDTGSKKAIIAFVTRVTNTNSPDFIPVPERIATFDNDGTLWAEKPGRLENNFPGNQTKVIPKLKS